MTREETRGKLEPERIGMELVAAAASESAAKCVLSAALIIPTSTSASYY